MVLLVPTVLLVLMSSELQAGGAETGLITVTAVDSDGRLLEGMSVTATASLSDA